MTDHDDVAALIKSSRAAAIHAKETFANMEQSLTEALIKHGVEERQPEYETLVYPEYTETIEYETRSVWNGCSCGHPGAGCYCGNTEELTGRFRVVRTFKKQKGKWQS